MSAMPLDTDEAHDVILQVMIPQSLKTEIAIRAARDGETHRTLVLKALRAIGFEIADTEIADRRKMR